MLFLPISLKAAIIINEVAWMGGPNSANHEWVELYNSGAEGIDVGDWTLTDGANLNINFASNNLTGDSVIAPYSYAVLERSSDDSAPSSAFLIYTGALVNTGATLTLKNSSGQIMDQVAGGENWQSIGGDNTSKETAQYTVSGWVTDIATPGKANRSGRVEVSAATTASKSSNSSVGQVSTTVEKPRSVSLVNANSELRLSLDMVDVAYVNQTVPFKISASGVGEVINSSLVYTWNFGDSYSLSGKEVEHHYSYPGTYVVTVNAAFARHNETLRKEITVLPITFSITKNEAGDIQIHNDYLYDIDISGFAVKGLNEVIFPPRTIILPRGTITIAKSRLKIAEGNLVALYDTKRNLVASTFGKIIPTAAADVGLATESNNTDDALSVLRPENFVQTYPPENQAFSFLAPTEDEDFGDDLVMVAEDEAAFDEGNESGFKPMAENWPYLAFIGLLSLALVGIYFGKK